jgi:hypothetical protein
MLMVPRIAVVAHLWVKHSSDDGNNSDEDVEVDTQNRN